MLLARDTAGALPRASSPREVAIVAACILSITLLGFFVFPGHTFLQSDTEIYIPMLERLWNGLVLPGDLVASRPHLSYTLYDECAIALRRLTGADFESILVGQQFLFRIAGVLGIVLLALSFQLSIHSALFVAAVSSLGAPIGGPAVLALEYEPVPRGFAVGLLFLAIGLASQRRLVWASMAASLAFLFHAPTTFPFWLVFLPLMLYRRRWSACAPLLAAVLALLIAAHFQAGVAEVQPLFARIDGEWERLLRLRAPYDWVSLWAPELLGQYLFLWAVSLVAIWRIRLPSGRTFVLGLPVIGLLSVPVSYVLLEKLKWNVIAQTQPARALLFVTVLAVILAASAALRSRGRSAPLESAAWFFVVFVVPLCPRLTWLGWRAALTAGLLAAIAAIASHRPRWLPVAALAAFVLPVWIGQVRNYPYLETRDLDDLVYFARNQTSPAARFLFADVQRGLQPGIFRARSLRTVYVDWKSGGQVNYYRSLGEDWWTRWEAAGELRSTHLDQEHLRSLGIDYVVLGSNRTPSGVVPIYRNSSYCVYDLGPARKVGE